MDNDWNRFNDQFRETPEERSERLRSNRLMKSIGTLQALIADLSDDLRDEGNDYSPDGLESMRRRVANALPTDKCPEWLKRYRDPAILAQTTGEK
jgi:hypothetical protein